MSARTFARSTALFATATFVPRVGLFLLLPLYARYLTQADLGAFSLMISLASLLAIVYRLGLDATLLRFHFDHLHDLGRLYSTAFALAASATLVLASSTILLLIPTFGIVFAGLPLLPFGLLAIAIAVGNAFQFIPFAWFRAIERPGQFLFYTAGTFLVATAVTIWLVAVAGTGVTGALIGQLASAVITLGLAMLLVMRLPRPKIDGRLMRSALRFSLPLVPHATSAWILNVSDRWLIALLIPLSQEGARAQVGVYWVGYQLGYAIALLATSLQSAWLPMVYRQESRIVGGQLVGAMALLVAAGLTAVATLLTSVGRELIAVVAGPEYVDALPVMGIVAFASVAYGLYAVVVPVFLHARRPGTLAVITAAAGGLNVLINLVAIPRLGINGAALATLMANVAYLGLAVAVARRIWPIPANPRRIAVILLSGSVLIAWFVMDGGGLSPVVRVGFALSFTMVALIIARPAVRELARINQASAPVDTSDETGGASSSRP